MFKKLHFYLISFVLAFKQPIPFAEPNLPKNKIHKVQIPGNQDVAVWWNKKSKEWNAVHDVCPHRQAELSLGVVNPFTNNIKCRYHGIEFNGCGECTMIPSSTFKPSTFSVKNYFVKEKYDLLWIDDKKDTDIIIDVLENKNISLNWFIDIGIGPSSLDFYIENNLDRLHLDHLHHKQAPMFNRYKPSEKYDKIITNWFNETGFNCKLIDDVSSNSVEYLFIGPYSIFQNTTRDCSYSLYIQLNNSHTKIFFLPILQKNIFNKFIHNFLKLIVSKLFVEDVRILNSQTKIINKYGKNYISSGVADTPIILYNKWLDKYGNETT